VLSSSVADHGTRQSSGLPVGQFVPSSHAVGYPSGRAAGDELELVIPVHAVAIEIDFCLTGGLGRFGRLPVLRSLVQGCTAGKLAAMMARSASRDLFDARGLLGRDDLDRDKLRLGFVAYAGMSRTDWRTIAIHDIRVEPEDVARDLVPMLRADVAPTKADIPQWTTRLVDECRQLMSAVLPLIDNEQEFLDQLNDHGEIRADLLTQDEALQQIIHQHPSLGWKALNVRKHHGIQT